MLWSDSDNENVQEQSEEINRVNNDKQSLHDILVEQNSNINPTQISKFNICRSHLWEGAVRDLNRKSFSPAHKVSIKFTDNVGVAEGAVDSEGSMREFFTLIIFSLSSQLFCATEREKYLSNISNYLTDDYYFSMLAS